MSFYISQDVKSYIYSSAENIAGVKYDIPGESAMFAKVLADVSAYINQDFEFLEAPDGAGAIIRGSSNESLLVFYNDEYGNMKERKTQCPAQIVDGVLVPMLAARLASGAQRVTSISEGGSSASVTPTYSDNVRDYLGILCKYRRLGYPKNPDPVKEWLS